MVGRNEPFYLFVLSLEVICGGHCWGMSRFVSGTTGEGIGFVEFFYSKARIAVFLF